MDVELELLVAHRRALDAQADMRQAARDRAAVIGRARTAGLTWSRIGELLGVSRARAEKMRTVDPHANIHPDRT